MHKKIKNDQNIIENELKNTTITFKELLFPKLNLFLFSNPKLTFQNESLSSLPETTSSHKSFIGKKRITDNIKIKPKIFLIKKIKDKIEELKREQIKKLNKENSYRKSSKYRGVTKNGNKWQVLIMINKKKRYIGNYKNEEEAASSYDIVAIQNHGSKAKTNFYYTPEEIDRIKKMKNPFENNWNN